MEQFQFFASPWWVNLLIAVPFAGYFFWRGRISLSLRVLAAAAIFGIAFGFVEAAVVVYLRAAVGLLPGYGGTLSDVARLSSGIYQQAAVVKNLPQSLFVLDFFREAATIVMLGAVAFLGARSLRDRVALFLWSFAFWDLLYYVFLYAAVRWPPTLSTGDVLFLIPVPWISQVWFPILVSALTIAAVLFARRSGRA